MVKKAKKTVRKPAAKAPVATKTAPPRKKGTTFKRIENAIEAGVAELDEMALSLGLLGAVEPAPKKQKTKKR